MDLEWLLPEQIEQILKLCDLSSIQDPTLAANILEQHHWNLEVPALLFSSRYMTWCSRTMRSSKEMS